MRGCYSEANDQDNNDDNYYNNNNNNNNNNNYQQPTTLIPILYSEMIHNFVFAADVAGHRNKTVWSSLHKNLFNQKETGYSSHSIIQCMENFVEAVHEMDDTILVPSRLMDLKVEASSSSKPDSKLSPPPLEMLSNFTNLFTLYSMVRNLKNQLQWGSKDQRPVDSGSDDGAIIPSQYSASSVFLTAPLLSAGKSHIRRPSTTSMSSTNSSAASSVISEADSEGSIENDSGIDAELDACIKTTTSTLDLLEQSFHRHLRGLSDTLKQLTEAARYVTKRYQEDVLGVVE